MKEIKKNQERLVFEKVVEERVAAIMETVLVMISNKIKTVMTVMELRRSDLESHFEAFRRYPSMFRPEDITSEWLEESSVAKEVFESCKRHNLKPRIVVKSPCEVPNSIAEMVNEVDPDPTIGYVIQITIEK